MAQPLDARPLAAAAPGAAAGPNRRPFPMPGPAAYSAAMVGFRSTDAAMCPRTACRSARSTGQRASGRSSVAVGLPGALAAALTAALAVATGLPVPARAQQAMPDAFSIDTGGWRGGAYARPDTMTFSHCGIARSYGETTLIFTRTPDHGLNIGLDGVEPPEAEGDRPAVALLTIDGASERALPALPAGDAVTVLPVGEDADLVERLRQGIAMTVRLGGREIEYPLTGTFDALPMLGECVRTAQEVPADQVAALLEGDPAGDDAASDAATDSAAAPEATSEATATGAAAEPPQQTGESAAAPDAPAEPTEAIDQQTLARLLAAAGFAPEQVAYARSDELPDNALDLDYAWQLDGRIVGGLHQRPRGEENEFDAFVRDYVERVETVCPGETASDISEIETFRERFGLGRATVTCRAGETTAHIELFMALDDRHYSAFFHEATPDQRPLAIEATEGIESVIRNMAGL